MARPLSTAVSVEDLVHVTEYLVRLAYAPLRCSLSAGDGASIRVEREAVLRTALTVESLGDAWERDRCADAEKCCADLQSVIEKTLSPDAIRRMRTAVRRMRMQEPAHPDLTLAARYERWLSSGNQAELDV